MDRGDECQFVSAVDAAVLPARLTAVAGAIGQRRATAEPASVEHRPASLSGSGSVAMRSTKASTIA
jgi:hypothetical protein